MNVKINVKTYVYVVLMFTFSYKDNINNDHVQSPMNHTSRPTWVESWHLEETVTWFWYRF